MIPNQEEAALYAALHPESNLACAYTQLRSELAAAKTEAEKWRENYHALSASCGRAMDDRRMLRALCATEEKQLRGIAVMTDNATATHLMLVADRLAAGRGAQGEDMNGECTGDDCAFVRAHNENYDGTIDNAKALIKKLREENAMLLARLDADAFLLEQAGRDQTKLREEVERIKDGIYAMSVGPEEQARTIDPTQWIKTRLVHVEHFNEALTQEKIKTEKLRDEFDKTIRDWSSAAQNHVMQEKERLREICIAEEKQLRGIAVVTDSATATHLLLIADRLGRDGE